MERSILRDRRLRLPAPDADRLSQDHRVRRKLLEAEGWVGPATDTPDKMRLEESAFHCRSGVVRRQAPVRRTYRRGELARGPRRRRLHRAARLPHDLRAFATSTRPLSEVFADRARNGAGVFAPLRGPFRLGRGRRPSSPPMRAAIRFTTRKAISSACAPDVAAVAVPLGRASKPRAKRWPGCWILRRHHHPGAPPRSGEAGAALPVGCCWRAT